MVARTLEPEHLAPREAAAHLGVTERTIRRLIESGDLPAYRVGSKIIRIKRTDIDALLRPIAAGGAA